MKSSSSRFEAPALAVLPACLVLASALTALAAWINSTYVTAAASGTMLASLVLALGLARSERNRQRAIGKMAETCARVGKGDFEARIIGIQDAGAFGELQHAINAMIDHCDAYLRESTASLETVSRGAFYRKILPQGMQGAFRTAAVTINAAVDVCKTAEMERRKSAATQEEMIGTLANALDHLAKRDLAFRLDRIPEGYAQVRSDFNNAMEQIEAALLHVKASTQEMSGATEGVARMASELSHRAEQQAASLEETAAALDEVTATVGKAAQSAEHARAMVVDTNNDAEASGRVVRQAVSAMEAIEHSSRQISQIIGVIDEIAFQTNLLALNAGVEAARAGESGRGFAVVASEVRALAQRSANAAREIKSLISTSTAQVGNGVALVAQAGQSVRAIMDKVAEINSAVGDIAAGAREQSTALQEVNAAINEMDRVTQANAEMAERATNAGHVLKEKGEKLLTTIDQFRIRGAEQGRLKAAARGLEAA